MLIDIRPEELKSLADYAAISPAFEVRAAVRLPTMGQVQCPLETRCISPPYAKDYDAIPGNHPRDWPTRFAIERACVLAAYDGADRVGGSIVIVEPADIARLGGFPDLFLLWDLRVAPHARRTGVGRALLVAVEALARENGARGISVETQDINVAACQTYAAAGFTVASVELDAYPDQPGEARMIWTKQVAAPIGDHSLRTR